MNALGAARRIIPSAAPSSPFRKLLQKRAAPVGRRVKIASIFVCNPDSMVWRGRAHTPHPVQSRGTPRRLRLIPDMDVWRVRSRRKRRWPGWPPSSDQRRADRASVHARQTCRFKTTTLSGPGLGDPPRGLRSRRRQEAKAVTPSPPGLEVQLALAAKQACRARGISGPGRSERCTSPSTATADVQERGTDTRLCPKSPSKPG